MIPKENITGLILAGGKSSRMGEDKGFLKLNDTTFIEYISAALKPLVSEIIISSNNPDYDVFGFRRVEDSVTDAGPVAGIYSGLKASKTAYNLVLSCDVPLISTAILKMLLAEKDMKYDVVLFKNENKLMPLIALYKSSCNSIFKAALETKELRLLNVLKKCHTKTIVLKKNEKALANINTKADLKELKAW